MNKNIKDKLTAWVKKQNDTVSIGPYIVAAAIMVGFLMLVGCASGHQKGDTYKVLVGKKCSKSGTIQSYVWLHTTLGPDQVSAKNCKNAKN